MSSIFQGLVEKAQGLVAFDVGTGDVTASYADLPGSAGDFFSTPDSVDNSIRQHITIEADIAPDDWADGTTQVLVSKLAGGTLRSYDLALNGTGQVIFRYSEDGTAVIGATFDLVAFPDGERHTIKVEFDPTIGSATLLIDGLSVQVRPFGSAPVSIFDSTTALVVGSLSPTGAQNFFKGKIYSTKIYKGIGSTFDPYVLLDGVSGTYVSTPDTVENSIRGSITIEVDATVDWAGSDYQELIDRGPAPNRAYTLRMNEGNSIEFLYSPDGAALFNVPSSVVVPITPNTRGRLKAEADLINGEVTFYWAQHGDDYAQLGNVVSTTPGTIFNPTTPVRIGQEGSGARHLDGIIYSAKVYKGIPNAPIDAYVRLDGVAGTYVSVPDSPALSITGDIDISIDLAMDDWSPAVVTALAAKWVEVGSLRSYYFRVAVGGSLQLQVSADGGFGSIVSGSNGVATGFADGARGSVRVTLDIATDTARFYKSVDGVAWEQIGLDITMVVSGISDKASPVEIGTSENGTVAPLRGTIYGAIIKSGIDGTTVLDMNPHPYIQGDPTFIGAQGNVFTLKGAAVAVTPRDDGLKVHMNPEQALQGVATFDSMSGQETWTLQGAAIANSPIDDGLKSYFKPSNWQSGTTFTGGAGATWTLNGDVTILASAMFRGMYWHPTDDLLAAVYASTGQAEASVGAGGLSFDADSRLRVVYGGDSTRVLIPGGMSTDTGGSLIIGGPPDVIHQGVGLTNECYVSDAALTELLQDAEAWFDETSFVGDDTVTDWNNKGTGGSPFNLDTVVGTAGNLTRMGNGVARLVGAVGDYFSTPDSVLNSVTGDIDIRWFGSLDDWTPAAISVVVSKWDNTADNREFFLRVLSDGTLHIGLSDTGFGGANQFFGTSTASNIFTNGALGGVRVTWNATTKDATFYTSVDGTVWVQLGTPVNVPAPSIFNGVSEVAISGDTAGINPTTGYCHSAQVYDGIDGTLAVNFNPSEAVAPQTAWTDVGTSAVWTPQGDSFVNTTGKDVVNAAGLVGIETAVAQAISQPFTAFMAYKQNHTPTTDEYFFAGGAIVFGKDSVADWLTFNAGVASLSASNSFSNNPDVLTAQFNGDASSALNNTIGIKITGDIGAVDLSFGQVFMNAAGGSQLFGWIGEFIVFDRALTADEISLMQDYLENKWT